MARYIEIAKDRYLDQLTLMGKEEEALKIKLGELYSPLLKDKTVSKQEEPELNDFNDSLTRIQTDLKIIDTELANSADAIRDIMNNTKLRFESIKNILSDAKERKEDLELLFNGTNATESKSIMYLKDLDKKGSYSYFNDLYMLEPISKKKVNLSVVDVSGNGYEGNKYVYKNEDFLEKTFSTSDRKNMVDGTLTSLYEYSRITVSEDEKEICSMANIDTAKAKCMITLKSEEEFSEIKISSDFGGVNVILIETSEDGISFIPEMNRNISLNDKTKQYEVKDYIPGSGVLSFTKCKYLRLTLESEKFTDDSLAFKKVEVNGTTGDKENSIGDVSTTETIVEMKSGKRHVIRINEITAYRAQYNPTGNIICDNFLKAKCSSIAIFVNENLYKGCSIKYFLTVNEKEYEICPINLNSSGKKIIRTVTSLKESSNVIYINEEIKSASLKIMLKGNDYKSPMINNLKILLGGDVIV